MADIKVRFEVNPNAEGDYPENLGSIINDNTELSNVSLKTNNSNIFEDIPTSESSGINGLSFGQDLVFNGEGFLDNEDLQGGVIQSEENPTEFVWGIVPDNKQYSVKLTFTGASNLKDIIVYGDKVVNQFPTRAIIDGTTEIFSDDYRWAINLETESETHTIEFTHWNRVDYNASLTFIAVMMKYFEINKRTGLKSVESLSQSTGQPKEIFYGVVPSTGSLEIIDIDGEIAEMVRDGVIPNSNIKTDIFSNGTKVQDNIINYTSYNNNSKVFSTKSTDIIDTLNNIKFDTVKFPKYIINLSYPNYSISNLYQLLSVISSKFGINIDFSNKIKYGFGNYKKVDTVQNYLTNIKLNNLYHSESIAIDVINEILQIAQLNLLQKDDGKLYVVNSRPILTGEESIISLPTKNQNSTLDLDLVLKNKYNNVKYTKRTLNKGIKEALNVSYNFKDENGNLVLENIDALNVQLIDNYLCFFKVVNTGNELSRFEGGYGDSDWGNAYPYSFMLNEGYDTSGSGGSTSTIYNSELTIEDFNFSQIDEGCRRLIKYSQPNSETFAFKINLSRNPDATYLNIILRCIGYELITENVVVNNNNNIYEILSDSTFINSETYYVDSYSANRKNMYELIAENIIEDYREGIKTASITINCLDYYDINGKKVKDWSKGEILQVGDIVRVDKDNIGNSAMKYADGSDMYFRVTGRNFRYAGVPLIDLELQEVKAIG